MSSDTLWGQLNGRPEWVPVKSAAAETIPSFAVMRVTGVDSATGALTVAKPDGSAAPVIVNGETMVPVGGFGKGTFHPRVVASFAAADGDPAVGEVWGPAADSWELHTPGVGFTFLGGASQGVGNWVQKGERDQNSGTDCCPPSRGTVYTEVPCSGSVEDPCIYFGNGNAYESTSYCPGGPPNIPCSDDETRPWLGCDWWWGGAVHVPCACDGQGMDVPGTMEVVASGTGAFSALAFTASSTFAPYGTGWPINYVSDDEATRVSGRLVYCCAADQWGFVGTVTTRDDDGSVCRLCTTHFNGCVIGTAAGGTTMSEIDCTGESGPGFELSLHTDCGTVVLSAEPAPEPLSCCDAEVGAPAGNPDVEVFVPDGPDAGAHAYVWNAAGSVGPAWYGGGSITSRPRAVRCSGTTWQAEFGGWFDAVSQTCSPAFAATFAGATFGISGNVQVTKA